MASFYRSKLGKASAISSGAEPGRILIPPPERGTPVRRGLQAVPVLGESEIGARENGARLVPSRSGHASEYALAWSDANPGCGRAAEWDTPRSAPIPRGCGIETRSPRRKSSRSFDAAVDEHGNFFRRLGQRRGCDH